MGPTTIRRPASTGSSNTITTAMANTVTRF